MHNLLIVEPQAASVAMEKRTMVLSSAYKCQKVICRTLRLVIPLCLVLGIVLGVLISIDSEIPVSPSFPVIYQSYHDVNKGSAKDTVLHVQNTTARSASIRPANSTEQFNTSTLNEAAHIDPLLAGLPLLYPLGERVMATNLSELKVYIYQLPKGFNKNLADCAVRNARSAMCFDITNSGRGALLRTDFVHGYSIFNTHQFALEVLFHQRLLQSEFLTWDPGEADLFYVPYYVAMRCFCPAQDGASMNSDLWQTLHHGHPHLRNGRPHFTALGNLEQAMASKACPFLQESGSPYMKYLLIEQTASIKSRRYFHRLGREQEVLVVPFPSFIHFDRPLAVIGDTPTEAAFLHGEMGESEKQQSGRSILALVVGSIKKNPLRLQLANQLKNSSVGYAYIIPPSECWLSTNNVPLKIVSLMHRSVFCLQPPGDTPTRKSFFDAVLSGCVPVIFQSAMIYPYMDIFNYSTFSVYIPEEAIVVHNKSVISILEAISSERVRSMQQTLASVALYFQYGNYRHGNDAFTLALKRLVHRFYLRKFTDQTKENHRTPQEKYSTR